MAGRGREWTTQNKIQVFLGCNSRIVSPQADTVFQNLTMAMINCFCPPLMEDTERHQQIALDALARSQMDNRMKKRVARDKLDRRTENWTTASAGDVQGFPILSLQDLEKLTLGVYQVSLAKEYTKKHLSEDSKFTIQINSEVSGVLRAKLASRFTSRIINSE